MMKEEKQLNIELESFEKKIQSWTSSTNMISSRSKTHQQDEKKNMSMPPEVKAFQVHSFHCNQLSFSFYCMELFVLLYSSLLGLFKQSYEVAIAIVSYYHYCDL